MRSVLGAAMFVAAVAVSPATQSAGAQTSTTTHRSTASAARHRSASAQSAAPQEGLAAVGSMPAVTGTVKTLYALRYVDLKIGTGEAAQTHKFYTVHYTGWTLDGQKFDSSFDHDGKEPIVFPVGARRVIVGWDTGFEGMRVGGKRRLIVPYQLAYGELGRPPIPPKADLIFDVELLAQSDTPPQQAAPVTPAAVPPASAAPKTPPQPGSNPATDPANKPAAKPE